MVSKKKTLAAVKTIAAQKRVPTRASREKLAATGNPWDMDGIDLALLDPKPTKSGGSLNFLTPRELAIHSLKMLESEFFGEDNGFTTHASEAHRQSIIGHMVLEAINLCACNDIPIPPWAAKSFAKSYSKVMGPDCNSWDAGFGKPHRNQQEKMRKFEAQRADILVFIAKTIQVKPKSKRRDDVMNKFSLGEKLVDDLIKEVERFGANFYLG